MGWWESNGFAEPGTPVAGRPGYVYNEYGGYEPIGSGGYYTKSDGTQTYVNPYEQGGFTGGQAASSASPSPQVAQVTATGNRQQDISAILQRYPHTPEGLKQALPDIQKLYPNVKLMGSKGDKLDFGDGEVVDVIEAAGEGGKAWTWQSSRDAAPSSNSLSALGGDAFGYTSGSLLTPWEETFQNPYGDAPTYQAYQPFQYDQEATYTPYTPETYTAPAPFELPSSDQVLSEDPGYAFRLKQGNQGLTNSAAARGVLNTGGTLKDFVNYNQDAASQEYQNAVNRRLGVYNTNANTSLAAFGANANAAQNAAALNLQGQQGAWDRNFQNAMANWQSGANENTAANAFNADAYKTNYNNELAEYLQRYNQFNTNQGNQFNRLYALSSLGAGVS